MIPPVSDLVLCNSPTPPSHPYLPTISIVKVLGAIARSGGVHKVGLAFFLLPWIVILSGGFANLIIMNRGLSRGVTTLLAVPLFSGSQMIMGLAAGVVFWEVPT